ncbi:MAG: garA 6 [Planctomycetaceae bacterium]|nr:garA 6 [Planctomycetaceae bacterium]
MTARLVPLSEGSIAIVLDKAITLIGRHPDCDAVLDDNQKISRRHCCIAQVDNRLVLRDLGSMNGIRVNGEPIVEVDLVEGDEITIGDEEFVLELKSKAGTPKRSNANDLPTPEKPKRSPKPISAPPAARRAPLPSDLSQEFPVAIPDELEEEDLRPKRGSRSSIPDNGVRRRAPDSRTKEEDDSDDSDDSGDGDSSERDDNILKLDSGEIELNGL